MSSSPDILEDAKVSLTDSVMGGAIHDRDQVFVTEPTSPTLPPLPHPPSQGIDPAHDPIGLMDNTLPSWTLLSQADFDNLLSQECLEDMDSVSAKECTSRNDVSIAPLMLNIPEFSTFQPSIISSLMRPHGYPLDTTQAQTQEQLGGPNQKLPLEQQCVQNLDMVLRTSKERSSSEDEYRILEYPPFAWGQRVSTRNIMPTPMRFISSILLHPPSEDTPNFVREQKGRLRVKNTRTLKTTSSRRTTASPSPSPPTSTTTSVAKRRNAHGQKRRLSPDSKHYTRQPCKLFSVPQRSGTNKGPPMCRAKQKARQQNNMHSEWFDSVVLPLRNKG